MEITRFAAAFLTAGVIFAIKVRCVPLQGFHLIGKHCMTYVKFHQFLGLFMKKKMALNLLMFNLYVPRLPIENTTAN